MNNATYSKGASGRSMSKLLQRLILFGFMLVIPAFQLLAQNFTVSGKRILDPSGNEFIPKGANIGLALWGALQYDATTVNYVKNHWKLNTVRVYNELKTTRVIDGQTVANANRLSWEQIDAYVQAYTVNTNGPKVVVMFECHDFSGSFYTATSNPSLTDLTNFWKEMARRYKGNPYVWFNIMNEPGGNQTPASTPWYSLHKSVIQAIRAEGANNMIVVDGMNFASEDGGGDFKSIPISDERSGILTYGQTLLNTDDPAHNLLFSFHIYEAWKPGGVPKMVNLIDRIHAKGLAVMVGEFASGNAGKPYEVSDVGMAMFNAVTPKKVGWLFWAWGTGDNTRLTTTTASANGINRTDGTRPTNLTWAGTKIWDDTHGITTNLGVPLNRFGWALSASNTTAAYPINNAIDGDIATGYASGADMAPGMYFQIDLGSAQSFNRVVFANGGADNSYPRGYRIWVSNDGANFNQVASGSNAFSDLNVSFATQTARYIKVENTASFAGWMGIREVFVYAPGDETAFINNYFAIDEAKALPRTGWTASASNTAESPGNALDNNLFTRFTSGVSQASGQTFTLDMKATQTFDKIVLHTGNSDPVRAYQVFVSNDGTNWGNPVARGRVNNYMYTLGSCHIEYISFPAQSARYIQIRLAASFGGWFSINELKVYRMGAASALSGTYRLIARHSGKALEVANIDPADGTNVRQWNSVNGSNQQWLFTDAGGGYYKLTAKHSNKALALDINAATNGGFSATAPGANVFQFGTDNADNRLWRVEATGDGYYRLTSKYSGKVLAVDLSSATNGGKCGTCDGANVFQWDYTGDLANKQWKLELVTSSAREGVEEVASEQLLSVYPNPAQDEVTLESAEPLSRVEIVNSRGTIGLSKDKLEAKRVKLQVSGLAQGIYIIRATTTQGKALSQKLLISR